MYVLEVNEDNEKQQLLYYSITIVAWLWDKLILKYLLLCESQEFGALQ